MKDKVKAFIDTNVLVYSIYGSSEQKAKTGLLLTDHSEGLTISTQVLKEFTNVSLKKKLVKSTDELKRHLTKIQQTFVIQDVSAKTILAAVDLKDQYKYSFYDSLIIASALENKCNILFSDSLQHGQSISKKLKIVNPYK
jgi:predicted nucleic acid-binding protein